MITNQIVYAGMVIGGCLLAYPYGIVAAPVVFGMRAAALPPIAILVATGLAVATLGVILILLRPRWMLGDFMIELLGDAGRLTGRFRRKAPR